MAACSLHLLINNTTRSVNYNESFQAASREKLKGKSFKSLPENILTPHKVLIWLEPTPTPSRNSNLVSHVPSRMELYGYFLEANNCYLNSYPIKKPSRG